MAMLVTRVDDFDHAAGERFPAPAEVTVPFNYDGADYFLDLTAERAAEYMRVMAPYVKVAKKIQNRRVVVPIGLVQSDRPPKKPPGTPPPPPSSADTALPELDESFRYSRHDSFRAKNSKKAYRQMVRAYWRDKGHDLGDHGRVPREAYVHYANEVGTYTRYLEEPWTDASGTLELG